MPSTWNRTGTYTFNDCVLLLYFRCFTTLYLIMLVGPNLLFINTKKFFFNFSYTPDSKWPRSVFAQSSDRTLTPPPTAHFCAHHSPRRSMTFLSLLLPAAIALQLLIRSTVPIRYLLHVGHCLTSEI